MNVLVVDLTHGGLKIIEELLEQDNEYFQEFWAWDIYDTLDQKQKSFLIDKKVTLISGKSSAKIEEVVDNRSNFKIIAPIHCPIEPDFNLKPDISHHQAIKLILNNWKQSQNIPLIEITGVKGKTSVAGILKEILLFKKPLILSSLGAEIIKDNSAQILKKNISITPASIIETVRMAEAQNKGQKNAYGICIFETSLGGTGMADIGILTNIAENYTIAQGHSDASKAKAQIFDSKMTCCEYETLTIFYSDLKENSNYYNINTFSLKDPEANLKVLDVDYDLKSTRINISAHDLKTLDQDILNENFWVETFAPAPHHVNNVLAAICAALTLGINIQQIQKGIEYFKGLEGRTYLRFQDKSTIIEEINPGINVNAIEKTIRMAQKLDNSSVILGGQYGITCEEIDELKAANVLDKLIQEIDLDLILTDELGKGILEKMNQKPIYMSQFQDALNDALKKGVENIVVIYRSNYSNLKKR